MNIQRTLKNQLIDKLKTSNKIIILYGARQVGKTTLINAILDELNLKSLKINGDQTKFVDILFKRF